MRSTVPIFVEARDLRATVGLSRPRVYALMAVGEFPLPRRISKARVAWLRSDLEKWAAWRPVSAEPVRHIIPDQADPRRAGRAQAQAGGARAHTGSAQVPTGT